ncbi:MAG: thioredoxin family protein [Methylobacterium sp.]|uniref:thioredoxin family protein n=1 Tax=Methylobacterium sp. TaxID=409 RepID=UPI0025D801E6|nr:thioredoxin family protein [Methylobacterium sp.]MBX9931487.1 thioredoxin family protein [Methylobacterium sp.]
MLRRSLLSLIAVLSLVLAGPGYAANSARFSPEAFEAAQKAGKPILVEVSAPWCPICKSQKAVLAKLVRDPRFKNLQIFDVDFDSQKDVLRRFDARMQSTLIVFKGTKEVGRSVGETQAEWIEGLIEKSL